MARVFVATLASGDTIQYSYKGEGTVSGDQSTSGTNTWTITGGHGEARGH